MNAKKAESIEVLTVPLSDVIADFKWNGRFIGADSGKIAWSEDSGAEDSETNDFTQLRVSIRDRGQDTPATVRPKGKKFALVAGFRRYLAIKLNAEESKDPNPMIRVIVKDLDDLQARLENARENTERQAYRPADLCWTVKQAKAEYEKKKVPFTQEMLASDFGQSQGYVAKLLKIGTDLDSRIFDEWRSYGREVGIAKMYAIATKPTADQKEAWENAKKAAEAPRGGGKSAQQKAAERLSKLKSEAWQFGWTIGQLYFCAVFGKLAANEVKKGLSTNYHLCVTVDPKKPLTDAQRTKVIASLEEGFDDGNQVQEDDEEKEAAE